nr:hypothetical protein CFP56_56217 [Quercus suber]
MGRKRQLSLVYIRQGSSHSQQRVKAADEEAHISKEATTVASDNETQAPDDHVQTPTPVQNPTPENKRARRGKTRLPDKWAMTGEYKI